MAKQKAGRPKTREERDAGATVTAIVTGPHPIRDAVTRESVEEGGMVRLNPAETLIDALVEIGAVKVVPADKPKAAKAA